MVQVPVSDHIYRYFKLNIVHPPFFSQVDAGAVKLIIGASSLVVVQCAIR